MDEAAIGIVGCGVISDVYFEAGDRFDAIDVVACADIDAERAASKADEHRVSRACTTAELLADDAVDIVVVLTPPASHADVVLDALEAGKTSSRRNRSR